ncbi:MAG: sigma-70 family RNA polymerase sigma factor [Bacteroidota bacterium]
MILTTSNSESVNLYQNDLLLSSSFDRERDRMTKGRVQFEQVHAEYRPKILRYLRRMVGLDEAQDLSQDVFVKVKRGLGGLREDSGLSTWIYRIATNTALDRIRSPSYKRSVRLADAGTSDQNVEIEIPDQDPLTGEKAPTVEQQHVRDEMNSCIRRFIENLPETYRSVVVLGELEGLKNREIAEVLDVSLDTVKIRLHRARAQLREKLEKGCSFYRDGGGVSSLAT